MKDSQLCGRPTTRGCPPINPKPALSFPEAAPMFGIIALINPGFPTVRLKYLHGNDIFFFKEYVKGIVEFLPDNLTHTKCRVRGPDTTEKEYAK
jgi:hypothetical protein